MNIVSSEMGSPRRWVAPDGPGASECPGELWEAVRGKSAKWTASRVVWFDPGGIGGLVGESVTQILEDPFSAVSKPNFATEGLCCSTF